MQMGMMLNLTVYMNSMVITFMETRINMRLIVSTRRLVKHLASYTPELFSVNSRLPILVMIMWRYGKQTGNTL